MTAARPVVAQNCPGVQTVGADMAADAQNEPIGQMVMTATPAAQKFPAVHDACVDDDEPWAQ